MRNPNAAAMLFVALAAACGESVSFELDVVLTDGPSGGKWVRVYLRDLDGPVCRPEIGWPAVGQCSQSNDYSFCSGGSSFRCLGEIRVEHAGAVIARQDVSQWRRSEVGLAYELPIATVSAAELVFEGCGHTARAPLPLDTTGAPVITAARDDAGVDLTWMLPPEATSVVYDFWEEGSFSSRFCRTESTADARITVSGERRLNLWVMALPPPVETHTAFGLVRVWNAGIAGSLLEPVP